MNNMNKKDLLVLSHLRENARETLTSLSKKTKIPISTIYDKLKNHEGSLITKHTTLLDFNRLGFNTRANIMLKVDVDKRTKLLEYLMTQPNVNSVYKINNGFDVLVEGVFRNIMEVEDFLEMIDTKFLILEKELHYIIADIRRERFMSDPQFLEMLF